MAGDGTVGAAVGAVDGDGTVIGAIGIRGLAGNRDKAGEGVIVRSTLLCRSCLAGFIRFKFPRYARLRKCRHIAVTRERRPD